MGTFDNSTLVSNTKHSYTYQEAKQVEKERLKNITTPGQSKIWIDKQTGKQVYFGV
jgi:hypothetical protein